MSRSKRDTLCLQDVFQEFTMEAKVPDSATLNKFINKYPHYAKELAEFATEWITQECIPQVEEVVETTGTGIAMSKAMSYLQNKLYELDQEKKSDKEEALNLINPFERYTAKDLKSIAEQIGIDITIMAKLKERKIDFSNEKKSQLLFERLSNALKTTTEIIKDYLSWPALIPEGADFSSKNKPEAGRKESFEEAINRSTLSTEEKEEWLK